MEKLLHECHNNNKKRNNMEILYFSPYHTINDNDNINFFDIVLAVLVSFSIKLII